MFVIKLLLFIWKYRKRNYSIRYYIYYFNIIYFHIIFNYDENKIWKIYIRIKIQNLIVRLEIFITNFYENKKWNGNIDPFYSLI